jgi:hypothetical protein
MTRLGRAGRIAAWIVGIPLATIGVVAGSAIVAVLTIFAALMAGLAGYSVAHRRGLPAGREVVRFAAAGIGTVLVVAGTVVLLGPLTVPIVAVAAVIAAWRLRGLLTGNPVDAAHPDGPPSPAGEAELTRLSNAELGREWRLSHMRLVNSRTADELGRLCGLRRLQLDEIERRDPAGFRRWLDSGSWVRGDSAPFLGG